MRYDTMLRAIERASARYEAEIQQILRQFAKSDTDTATALVAGLRPTKKAKRAYKKKHWTQKPENKQRVAQMLTKATKARHGKKV